MEVSTFSLILCTFENFYDKKIKLKHQRKNSYNAFLNGVYFLIKLDKQGISFQKREKGQGEDIDAELHVVCLRNEATETDYG